MFAFEPLWNVFLGRGCVLCEKFLLRLPPRRTERRIKCRNSFACMWYIFEPELPDDVKAHLMRLSFPINTSKNLQSKFAARVGSSSSLNLKVVIWQENWWRWSLRRSDTLCLYRSKCTQQRSGAERIMTLLYLRLYSSHVLPYYKLNNNSSFSPGLRLNLSQLFLVISTSSHHHPLNEMPRTQRNDLGKTSRYFLHIRKKRRNHQEQSVCAKLAPTQRRKTLNLNFFFVVCRYRIERLSITNF